MSQLEGCRVIPLWVQRPRGPEDQGQGKSTTPQISGSWSCVHFRPREDDDSDKNSSTHERLSRLSLSSLLTPTHSVCTPTLWSPYYGLSPSDCLSPEGTEEQTGWLGDFPRPPIWTWQGWDSRLGLVGQDPGSRPPRPEMQVPSAAHGWSPFALVPPFPASGCPSTDLWVGVGEACCLCLGPLPGDD